MSVIMQYLLFGASVLTALYIRQKLKKSQMRIADALFWIFFSFVLIMLSLFPDLCIWFAKALGFVSPVNFVFLVMIFLLVLRCFILSVHLSNLESKFELFVEEWAIRENMKENMRSRPPQSPGKAPGQAERDIGESEQTC